MLDNSRAMGTRNPRIDEYIAKAAPFAQPILRHLRDLVHEACPEVEEEMKWSFPNFMYKGMFCSMAAFKAHCSFGFWKESLIVGKNEKAAMGSFGRITAVDDLPSKRALIGYIKEAKRLNDEGISKPKEAKPAKKKELAEALDNGRVHVADNEETRKDGGNGNECYEGGQSENNDVHRCILL